MKAQDFITEVPLYPETSSELERLSKEAGYTRIGGGLDADVFLGKNKDEVVKVLIGVQGRSPVVASKGFLKFYDFVKQHQNHPNLPKFGVPVLHKIGKEKVYFVTMERLHLIPKQKVEFLVDLIDYAQDGYPFVDAVKWLIQNHDLTSEEGLTPENRQFYKIIQACIAYVANDKTMTFDMHEGNMLQRSDGTVVITDPYIDSL